MDGTRVQMDDTRVWMDDTRVWMDDTRRNSGCGCAVPLVTCVVCLGTGIHADHE